jgi:DNA mismatch repair protein MutS2
MNEKALRVLEYPKIIEMLTEQAASAPGKEKCRQLIPSSDLAEVIRMQRETGDALKRIYRKGAISFSGVKDLRADIMRLTIGSSFGISELLDIAKLLDAAGRAKQYAKAENLREEEAEPDSLDPMFQGIEPLPALAREIRRCILSEEEIADDASPALRHIRRQISLSAERIRSQLNSIVNGSMRAYLQDAIITQRDGRYCIPVKAEHRSQVPGMIHDQSSTGSTLFVEPMAVVKLNNDIRQLEADEKKEIERILAVLSASAAEQSEYLISDIQLMTELDFIFARASLAKKMNATAPDFNEDGIVDLHRARHPLIDRKKVVPIDIRVGRDFDLLVISGPNTGGKTVSLKTVGLLTLMGQAGLHIPAAEHSELTLFTEVFADIGDEQSIEQSLSTFSSHMTNIVSFWKMADEKSLVLFDELGAGTDPEEGAALAIAILSSLHGRGIRTIATTHYSELKIYALSTYGVENACCEFDVGTLRPTYRLLIGVPGKSNAFAISRKLGLPEEIIEEARRHISEEEEDFEDVISDLENRRLSMEQAEDEISRNRAQIKALRDSLASSQQRLNDSREKILEKARQEAAQILRETKQFADETIRNYNKYGGSANAAREMERERTRLREKIASMDQAKSEAAVKTPHRELTAEKIHIGDRVHVISMNLDGTVLSLPDAKGNLQVQMGILHSQVSLKDIALIEEAPRQDKKVSSSGAGRVKMSKSASVSTEINLLGKTVDEALPELDKYLDDAYLAHLPSVRIVHGKGTGALRKAVHDYLRRQKHVDSYRLGQFGEGDAGVTIVTFR